MQFQNINLGFKGKFQVTVKNADGSVKTELPWQDNLVTDTGLKLLNYAQITTNLGTNLSPTNSYLTMNANCMIGASSIEPTITDTQLGELIAVNSRAESFSQQLEEPTETRPNHLRQYWRQKYIFLGLNNVNVTELGLGKWQNNNTKEYVLFTHALIKDEQGRPATITVLQGEILEINYEFSTYWDLRPKKGEFTLTKVKGTQREEETYEYLAYLGKIDSGNANVGIRIKPTNTYITTYGVNTEVDTDLSIPYNFDKWAFPKVNTKHWETINAELQKYVDYSGKLNGGYNNVAVDRWTYSVGDVGIENEVVSDTTYDVTLNLSPYTYNHPNGIRFIEIPVGPNSNYTPRASYMVVVAKKGSSHGIMKTDIDVLKLSFRTEVTRYEGTP